MSVCKLVNRDGSYRKNGTAAIFKFLEESISTWHIGTRLAEIEKTHALSTRTSHIRQQLPGGDYYDGSERLEGLKLERERRGVHWFYRLVRIPKKQETGQLGLSL